MKDEIKAKEAKIQLGYLEQTLCQGYGELIKSVSYRENTETNTFTVAVRDWFGFLAFGKSHMTADEVIESIDKIKSFAIKTARDTLEVARTAIMEARKKHQELDYRCYYSDEECLDFIDENDNK